MQDLFDPVVSRIEALVQEVLCELEAATPGAACDVLLMVGGFSDSPYLEQRVRQLAEREQQRVREVVVPPYASAAVVQGKRARRAGCIDI